MLRIMSITLAGAAMLIAWQAGKRIAFIVALLAILCGVAQAAGTNPNIVVILADDLGYGDVSCYNAQSKVPTPRIDRLARRHAVHRRSFAEHGLHADALQPAHRADAVPCRAGAGVRRLRRAVFDQGGPAHAATNAAQSRLWRKQLRRPRTQTFRAARHRVSAPGQLYNLADDPGETTNLYFQHPEVVQKLKALLEISKAQGRSVAPATKGRGK